MRIEIEIPKEFEEHFNQDKFEDALHRLSSDTHLVAGRYEQETAVMLIKAFKESKPAYDVDKVVEELEKEKNKFTPLVEQSNKAGDFARAEIYSQMASEYTTAIEIVKQGGVSDDCCEWEHSPTDNNVIRPFHHKDVIGMYEDVLCKFPYCPVCGKKIKVVE